MTVNPVETVRILAASAAFSRAQAGLSDALRSRPGARDARSGSVLRRGEGDAALGEHLGGLAVGGHAVLQRTTSFDARWREAQVPIGLVGQPRLDEATPQASSPAVQGLAAVDAKQAFQQVDLLLIGSHHVDGIARFVHHLHVPGSIARPRIFRNKK